MQPIVEGCVAHEPEHVVASCGPRDVDVHTIVGQGIRQLKHFPLLRRPCAQKRIRSKNSKARLKNIGSCHHFYCNSKLAFVLHQQSPLTPWSTRDAIGSTPALIAAGASPE
eukprot:1184905-Amphidinium_carterae.2